MENMQIQKIFDEFDHKYEYQSKKEIVSGHINDTYLIETNGDEDYILQRINHTVFKDVPGLVKYKVAVSHHIKEKLSHLRNEELSKKVLCFVKMHTRQRAVFCQTTALKRSRDVGNGVTPKASIGLVRMCV